MSRKLRPTSGESLVARITAKRDLLAAAREEYRAGRAGYDTVIYAEVQLAAVEQERRDTSERRKAVSDR